MKYSIIIPTYNHCDDLLKPCLESILQYTNIEENIEIIVVANGCTDNTQEYIDSLQNLHIHMLWFDEPLGYTVAINHGIRKSIELQSDYTILMNNDVKLLNFASNNQWLEMLTEPFINDEKVKMSGTSKIIDDITQISFIIFYMAMIQTSVFNEIGVLDEIFNPGYGEDIDFSIRLQKAGYKIARVPEEGIGHDYTERFPLMHTAEQTVHDEKSNLKEIFGLTWEETIARNSKILKEKYPVNNKLSLKEIKTQKFESLSTNEPNNIVNFIIATYNRHVELRRALSSIETQTYNPIKVWVCADGEDDQVKSIIEEFDELSTEKEYHYLALPEHEGLVGSKPRMMGIDAIAPTGVVCFLDDDNTIDPTYTDKLFKLMRSDGNYQHNEIYVDNSNVISYCIIYHNDSGTEMPVHGHVEGDFQFTNIDTLNVMVNSYVAKQCKHKWRHIAGQPVTHDFDFITECAKYGKSVFLNELLANHHMSLDKTSKEKNIAGLPSRELLKKTHAPIFDELYTNDIYNIKEDEVKNATVIDIGAHFGYFGIRCLELGAKYIHYFEPNPTTFKKLTELVGEIPNVTLYNTAVFDGVLKQIFMRFEDVNADVFGTEQDLSVAAVSLAEVMQTIPITDNMVLKLDCEGSEYEILLHSPIDVIRNFNYIYMEVHDQINPNFMGQTKMLLNYLKTIEFDVIYQAPQFGLWYPDGHFEALPIQTYKLRRNKQLDQINSIPIIDKNYLKTLEPLVYYEIFDSNVYNMDDTDIKDSTIIDIGANYGFFSLRAMEMGAKNSYCFEPEANNYNTLQKLTNNYAQIKIFKLAVFDGTISEAHIQNKGISSNIWGSVDDEKVQCISLQDVMSYLAPDDTQLVLKLDCEGCEYEILYNTPLTTIQKFTHIYLEVHDEANPNYINGAKSLLEYLEKINFKVIYQGEQLLYQDSQNVSKPMPIFVYKLKNVGNTILPGSILKLNLGCGNEILDGYVNCDIDNIKADMIFDAKKIPFPDNSVDEIRSSHMIEHLTHQEGFSALKEWNRVLKPNGKLMIETPDLLSTCKLFAAGDANTHLKLYGALFGFPNVSAYETHYFLYTEAQLGGTLQTTGFVNISRVPADSWHSAQEGNPQDLYLKMTAYKPDVITPERKVYDCFLFYNELDLLELRLNELNDCVDKFVLVESSTTFTGIQKPFYYNENKERFKQFEEKIIHIMVDDTPKFDSPWGAEEYQRNSIYRGIQNCKDTDIILISDVDEIPNPECITNFDSNQGIWILQMKTSFYYFNCVADFLWWNAKIGLWQDIRKETANNVRSWNVRPIIENGGWHFTALGSVDTILEKLNAFSHTEYNTERYRDKERLEYKIKNAIDIYERTGTTAQYQEIDNTFPKYIRDHIDFYTKKGYIYPITTNSPIIPVDKLKELNEYLYTEVFTENGYQLTEADIKDKVFVDIGAHFGYASMHALLLGAKKAIAFEPNKTNYEVLKSFSNDIPQIEPYNLAVSNSFNFLSITDEGICSNVFAKSTNEENIPTISLFELSQKLLPSDRAVLKIDCEGSEYDIVYNCSPEVLQRFDILYMEIHNGINPDYIHGSDDLVKYIDSIGFDCQKLLFASGFWQPDGSFIPTDNVFYKCIKRNL